MLLNYGFIVSVSTSIRNPYALSFLRVEDNVMVTLAGVVLFNYGFIVSVSTVFCSSTSFSNISI